MKGIFKMSAQRLLFLGTVLAIVFLTFALPVWAATDILTTSFLCDQIQITYTSDDSLGQDEAIITITNNDTSMVIYQNPLGSFVHSVWGGTYTINFPTQAQSSNLTIEVQAGATATSKGSCSGLANPDGEGSEGGSIDYQAIAFGDGRFCFGRGEADAAVFPSAGGLVVYRLIGDSEEQSFVVSVAELAEVPSNPETNFLITSTEDNFIQFYRLNSGEYQINVGPDEEGKVHVCIFENIPDPFARTFSFFLK
jgi:hypothetical protein